MSKYKVLCLLLAAGALMGQTWQTGPNSTFQFWRFDGEYFPGTGKVYFLGGRTADGSTSGAVWSFDPVARTYANTGATMPVPVSNYEVCLLEDDYNLPMGDTYGLYIVGGRVTSGNYVRTVQVYYPITNTTVNVLTDPYPAVMTDTVPIPASGQVVDNKMYVTGGFQQARVPYVTGQTWLYDPLAAAGSRWTQLPDLNVARGYTNAAVIDSMLYACGGDTYDGTNLVARRWCERLNTRDPGAGWVRIRDLPKINGEARAFGFGAESPYGFANKIIIAGRGTWVTESAHCFIYDAVTDSWASFPSLNQARRNHAAALIPGTQGSNGIPGLWVWGGRQGSDNTILQISEFYQLALTGCAEPRFTPVTPRTLSAQPNPFAAGTVVRFALARPGSARLRIYSPAGSLVWSRSLANLKAGAQRIAWSGCDGQGAPVSAGVYLCELEVDGQPTGTRLVKLK